MLGENKEDQPDVKNTREYQAITFIEQDLEDGQACGSIIISLCKIFECTLSELCDIRDDFVPKVIFENPEITYFVSGKLIFDQFKNLEKIKQGEDIEQLKKQALQQILVNQYYTGLSGEVLCVGIAHNKKHCEMTYKVINI